MLAPTQSQLVTAGSTNTSSIYGAPPELLTNLTWRLINDADGTIVIAESDTGIVEIDDGHDAGLRRYDRDYTAPTAAGRYLAVWRYGIDEVAQTVVVAAGNVAFATSDDVVMRLGRALKTSEQDQVTWLLETAASMIADAAGYDEGWAAGLSPVPDRLRRLSVELVCRAMPNPGQYGQIRQQVGSYSIQVSQDNVSIGLTDAEVMMVRRTIHGRTTDSVHVDSGFIRAQDEYWLRKQAIKATDPAQGVQDVIA